MSSLGGWAGSFLRRNAVGLAGGVVFVLLGWLGFKLVSGSRATPAPRKTMQFTIVNLQPVQPQRPPPPPPPEPKPQIQPKIEEQAPTRVALKSQDFTPPDAPHSAPNPGGGGRLSLAAEGEGGGDAFNLAGNPGGRGILTGGGLGDGSGDGDGLGSGDGVAARFGWYYARIASELEETFRKTKGLSSASTRVELRVWADPDGRIRRVQLLKSTGDSALDEAIQSVVGMRLREPPPPGIPMPMIARLTARRAR